MSSMGSPPITVRAEKSTRFPIKCPRSRPSLPLSRSRIDLIGFFDFVLKWTTCQQIVNLIRLPQLIFFVYINSRVIVNLLLKIVFQKHFQTQFYIIFKQELENFVLLIYHLFGHYNLSRISKQLKRRYNLF